MAQGKVFKLRLDDTEFARWEAQAKLAGLSVASWVKMRCSEVADNVSPVDRLAKITKRKKSEVDTSICPHGFFKSACERCKNG